MRRITISVYLLTAGAGLYLGKPAALRGTPQATTHPRTSWNFIASDSIAGGISGPTLTRREAEWVPAPPPLAHPSQSPILGHQKACQKQSRKAAARKSKKLRRTASAVATSRVKPPARAPASVPLVVPNRISPNAHQARPVLAANRAGLAEGQPAAMVNVQASAAAANIERSDNSDAPDPEALRIRDELKRLHDDAEARRAFYDDLHRTVEEVRAGTRSQDSLERNVSLAGPSSRSYHQTFSEPATSPLSSAPRASEPARHDAPRAPLDSRRNGIDPASYRLVVHWAKVNGTPVQLALGVAWMESRLHQNPPRGAAGEVGMFQIMPERCVVEGWPAGRLSEPEFNARLGTLLLARYYQEEGSMARAAAKYVAGPGVFGKHYPEDVWAYINWYARAVEGYANYFSRYQG